jgi:hypothetical protein
MEGRLSLLKGVPAPEDTRTKAGYGQFKTKAFYAGDLSLYREFVHPLGWDRSALRQFLDKRLKRGPAVAAVLRMDPAFFTSNHASFFFPAEREQATRKGNGVAAEKGR